MNHIVRFIKSKNLNFLTKVKVIELKLLGKYGWSYCYNGPSNIQLGITNRCNFNCIWCYRQDIKKPNEVDMSKEQVMNILKQIKHMKTINFTDYGETLLYPMDDLIDIINYASTKCDNVTIATNGSLLTDKNIKLLGDSNLSVLAVSIDSPVPSDFKNIRRYDLNRLTDNMRKFTERTDKRLQISAVTTAETFGTFVDFPKYAYDVGAKGLHFQNLFETVDVYHRVQDTPENRKIAETIQSRAKGWEINCDVMSIFLWQHNYCYEPFQSMVVNSKYYACPCCAWMTNNLVKMDNLKKVWNGKEMREMRRMIIKQKYPKQCQVICRKVSK